MAAISDHGGGNLYYIHTPDRDPPIILEDLQGLLSVAAQVAAGQHQLVKEAA